MPILNALPGRFFAHSRSARLSRGLATIAPSSAFHIPVIDFSKFRTATTPAEKKATADEIVGAFKTAGFVYLAKHGISDAVVQRAFLESKQFFGLPQEVKDSMAWADPRSNRGYVTIGRERVTQSKDAAAIAAMRQKAPDYKESMEIGRDWDSVWPNQWPKTEVLPSFKPFMLDFFQTCHELHMVVMRSIALGLDLQEDFFDSKIDKQCHNLRLLSYPAIKRALLDKDANQARAGAHSDYGTLTLLFQDQVGGLQVQHPHTGEYIAATPIPGTIVINVGDLLSRWSNDLLRSTLHRVVAPPAKAISETEAMTPARQSIAFFSNPNFDAEIECLPNCGTSPKYPPVNTEKYIVGRLADTYS
ncbi:hypothetical protein BD626DRAFT_480999 [Schizophyllum amplum]|uniref:Fe2OG dioxygenase domain-containing protein n=1 Tax=Schizophyllum amplum TaxID=97359 RepID=A0A550CTQ9_9AGAR|nr:hypothetical protein BD626DRAFT_480999 [Auriculariopsis ampla]